ncbi:hypothetical protein CAEBREN_32379 [Caenorhabditis brenneri]|uniref:D-lactate dehydrogenase (cytochrome) n=1 Tax=Caenorhabditis brenneri TaxID=135651 RepID=G0PMM2_CAEBE|nr:hypothetical protein CAEBREN_32379 [Caenorhabditis brenneri]
MDIKLQKPESGGIWLIKPIPGYVCKWKDVKIHGLLSKEYRKCFVNVCHCEELPPPLDDLDQVSNFIIQFSKKKRFIKEAIAAQFDSGKPTFRIPMSVGEVDCVKDKSNEDSMKLVKRLRNLINLSYLRVHPRPQFLSAAVCSFPSVHQAASTVVEILQWSIPVARIELLDTVQVQASNAYSNLTLRESPTLFIEFHGSSEKEVADQTAAVEDICKSHESLDFDSGASDEKMASLWKARHNAYYAALAMRTGARGFTTDVCVPISKLADVISETRSDLDEHDILGTVVGHVGDGNFHVILPTIEEDKTEHRKIQSFSDRLVRRALAADGTCTGEHGIGLGKRKYLREELGESTIRLMHTVKKALDPKNIMNPGKVLPEL